MTPRAERVRRSRAKAKAARRARRAGPLIELARARGARPSTRSVLSSTTLRSRTASGVTSTHSSGAQELERLVERELAVGDEAHEHVGGRGADVGEVLLACVALTSRSSGARVLADDHALVDLVAGADEQRAALLQVHQRELRGDAASGRRRARRSGGCAARRPTAPSGRRRGAAGRCRASR